MLFFSGRGEALMQFPTKEKVISDGYFLSEMFAKNLNIMFMLITIVKIMVFLFI